MSIKLKEIKKIIKELWFLIFFFRNYKNFSNVKIFKKKIIKDIVYRGYHSKDEAQVISLYQTLNQQSTFSKVERVLYRRQGQKMILVVERKGKIIGINIYYINKKDLKTNTVHEGFIGIIPEERGKGIANKLREISKVHFKTNGFSGISTRISENNMPSYKSALKVGFKSVEDCYDNHLKEKRHYMICEFMK